jgi:hypothetical protein
MELIRRNITMVCPCRRIDRTRLLRAIQLKCNIEDVQGMTQIKFIWTKSGRHQGEKREM